MTNMVDGAHLHAFIERIEKLESEKRAIADDIKDVYSEAKATGFDPKIVRKIVALRRIDTHKRAEEQELLDLYIAALGDLINTPLANAALAREFGVRP